MSWGTKGWGSSYWGGLATDTPVTVIRPDFQPFVLPITLEVLLPGVPVLLLNDGLPVQSLTAPVPVEVLRA